MTAEEARKIALEAALKLRASSDAETLVEDARKIEGYLLGLVAYEPGKFHPNFVKAFEEACGLLSAANKA